jgi:hypothetical protein
MIAGVIETFLDDGYVAVEHALDPQFCETVVAEAFERMGMREDDPATWPRGRTNLPVTKNWALADIAPRASDALHEVVPEEQIAFSGIQDNLIVNLPDPDEQWWSPSDWESPAAGWHKDGDWFRHFLDSPEQALLVIVFWRDVTADQGATYVAVDGIGPVARLLAAHPEGLDPSELAAPVQQILAGCRDFRALTGSQGDIVFAHPFLLHSASVNATARPRVISNTSVMLREPMRFDRPPEECSAVERSILHHLGVERLEFTPTGERGHVVSERERRWRLREPSEPGGS